MTPFFPDSQTSFLYFFFHLEYLAYKSLTNYITSLHHQQLEASIISILARYIPNIPYLALN